MATMTLLDMTQQILSNLSSDEVNSIGDTTESLQVANIIKQKYFDIVARSAVPEHNQLVQLTPSNDSTKPVLMYVPDEVNKIEWIKYFDSHLTGVSDPLPGYKYVIILPIQQFLDMVSTFNPTDSNVSSFVFEDSTTNFTLYYKDDATPSYCTVIGNQYVIFDTFDSTVDSTLQASKTMCFGQVAPVFRMEDDFIPDLNDNEFPLLLNEAKALAFYELKQTPHVKAEQEIKRQWSTVSKNKSVDNKPSYFDRLPDFGRRAGPHMSRRWWNGFGG